MNRAYDVLIYDVTEIRFTSEGLCGPLPAMSAVVSEEAGGDYILTVELAYDTEERWRYVQTGRVLKAYVQTRSWNGEMDLAPQLFDIIDVSWSLDGVSCSARHISYRLLQNVTTFVPNGPVTLAECVQGILGNCVIGHSFTSQVGATNARTVEGWVCVNPIDALLDPETGALAIFGAGIVRDNFVFRIGTAIGIDRGVTLECGKNLAGVNVMEDASEVATAIMPLGKTADGSVLYLPERYIVSSRSHGRLRLYAFDAENAQVGENISLSQALANMREQAQAMLAAGADLPSVSVSVDVDQVDVAGDAGLPVAIQETMIEQLEPMPIYDWITLRFNGVEIKEQMLRREWDCLSGRLGACELGTTQDGLMGMSLASWQIPSGISGTKLASGTVPGTAMQAGTIGAGQISQAAQQSIAMQAAATVVDQLQTVVPTYAWPVGAVYTTTDAADPAGTFGGTWASLGTSSQGGATVYWWERVS